MSILINGMDMPHDGRYTLCITHDSNGGVHWVIQNQDTLEFLKHGAVIEIPEPHGDLIDRDALPTSRVEWEDIVNAPTIIKANESDMDSFIRIFEEDDEKDGMDSFIRILKD